MEAITAESADNSAPAERYSAAIARELEKVRVEAAARDARFASFRVRPPEAQRVTEAEWLASHDPDRMLREVGPAASTRKLQLVMCACCRRVWKDIEGPYRIAVEVAEKCLVGEATAGEFGPAADNARMAWCLHSPSNECSYGEEAVAYLSFPDPLEGAISCARLTLDSHRTTRSSEAAAQASLLRCNFGNPFRPTTDDPGWRSETVLALAAGIFADCAFDRMPILADALQDAGCEDKQLLAHCRSSGTHVGGCWVLDWVLGIG